MTNHTYFQSLTKLLVATFLICATEKMFAQNIAVNTSGNPANGTALLDIGNGTAAAGGDTKGLLIPRVALTSSTDATTISSPATSLIVYNSGSAGLTPAGYYYWDGTTWLQLLNGGSPGTAWMLSGNSGTTPGTNFLGTSDNQDLVFKTANQEWQRIRKTTGYTTLGSEVYVGTNIIPGTNYRFYAIDGSDRDMALFTTTGNSFASKSVLVVSSNTTGGTGGSSTKLINLSRTGANANASHTAYGLFSSVANTGTTNTNIGVYATSTGGSSFNIGVYGYLPTTVTSGTNYAVLGKTQSILTSGTATGIYGDANTTSTGGTVTGAYGYADGNAGSTVRGIYAEAGNTGTSTIKYAAYLENQDATASTTHYGLYSEIKGAGAATTNIAGYFTATNAVNNYAIIIPSASGSVGVGTTAPLNIVTVVAGDNATTGPILSLAGTAANQVESGRVRLQEDNTAADGFLGGYIHYDGSTNLFHIGVHNTANQTAASDVNAITIDRVTATVGIGTNATATDQLQITKNFQLPVTTSTVGSINQGGSGAANRFIHNYSTTGNTAPASGGVGPNLFVGYQSGNFTLTGGNNTGIGYQALQSISSGFLNVGVGLWACKASATCQNNTGIGAQALESNTAGFNTAVGMAAFSDNVGGTRNVSVGEENLTGISSGNSNTSIGSLAMFYSLASTTAGGSDNTAIGYEALESNTNGAQNTAVGSQTMNGGANLTDAGAFGYLATSNANNKIEIGTVSNNNLVGVFGALQNWSDGRFKENVKSEVPGLAFIIKLHPVTYYWNAEKIDEFLGIKQHMDTCKDMKAKSYYFNRLKEVSSIKQTGFIAQEVESAAKEIGYEFDGVHHPVNEKDNYSLGYSTFVVPLVKAVQELNAKNETQQKTIDVLQSALNNQQSKIDALEKAVAELVKINSVGATSQKDK